MKLYYIALHSCKEATQLGESLLEHKLVSWYKWLAISSGYSWQAKAEELGDVKLIVKTELDELDKIQEVICQQINDNRLVVEISPSTVTSEVQAWLYPETSSWWKDLPSLAPAAAMATTT